MALANGLKPQDLVGRDVYGRVRHGYARNARVVNCDPDHCKGVWKAPPDILENR